MATALPFEAADLAASVGGRRRDLGRGWSQQGQWRRVPVELAVTGPGPRRVELAAAALVDPPCAVLSSGVAGALVDDCAPGEVVLAARVCTLDAVSHATDPDLRQRAARALVAARLPARDDACLGVDVVLESEAKKRAAARRSGAAIVQMEDQVWAERAEHWGVPFLSLRVVLDRVDRQIPEAALAFPWRGPSLRDALRILAPRPRELPALLELSWAQRRARRALSAALHCVVAALHGDTTPHDSS